MANEHPPDPAKEETTCERMLADANKALHLPSNLDWDTCLHHMSHLHDVTMNVIETPKAVLIEEEAHAWESFKGGKRFSTPGGWFYFFDNDSEPRWVPVPPQQAMGQLFSSIPGLLSQMGIPGMESARDNIVAFPGGRSDNEEDSEPEASSTTMTEDEKVTTDGRTVWVNDPFCVASFCPEVAEIRDPALNGAPSFFSEEPSYSTWQVFVQKVKEIHNIDIKDCHIPSWLEGPSVEG